MQDIGFIGALLDLSFSEFITTKLVRILYILLLLLIAIGLIVGIIGGFIAMFTNNFLTGLATIVLTPFVALISLIMSRVWMEIIIVVFRIAENSSDLVQMKKMQ